MELVVILHGYGRTSKSMEFIAHAFKHHAYQTLLIDYSTHKNSFADLSNVYLQPKLSDLAHFKQIHFVGHSMGSILIRYYLAENNLFNLGRVVQITPPNGGSEYVNYLKRVPFHKFFLSPALIDLAINSNLLATISLPTYDLGIINASVSLSRMAKIFLPKQNDGIISFDSCKLDGMKDFISLPYNHNSILKSSEAALAAIKFIQTGSFS